MQKIEGFVQGHFCVVCLPCSNSCHNTIQGIYSSFILSTLCKNVFAKTKIEYIQILHFKCARWDSKAVYYIISCPFLRHQTQFTKKDLTPWDNNLPSAQFFLKTTNMCTNIAVSDTKNVIICNEKHKISLLIQSTIKVDSSTLVKRIPRNTRIVFSLSDNTNAKILSRTGISNIF